MTEPARKSTATVAAMLVMLYDEQFGGKPNGRFRVSRKVLREIAGRRILSDSFLREVSEEVFELGFVLINCDAYLAVQSQKLFNSYRRVTKGATERVLQAWRAGAETAGRAGAGHDGLAVRDDL